MLSLSAVQQRTSRDPAGAWFGATVNGLNNHRQAFELL
jgi:hypothetical protein